MKTIQKDSILSDYFSPIAFQRSWGKVEAALASTQGELGMIPLKAAEAISAAALNTDCDTEVILSEMERIGHPLIPFLRELEKDCGEHGTWLHFGATTDNITHTGLALLMKDALKECSIQQTLLLENLCTLALKYAETVMVGRTHSQQALPITFGCKVAGWLDEYVRHLERQQGAAERSLSVMMGGAIGSYASFKGKGPEVQAGVAQKLGLGEMPLPLRSITDGWAELASVYSLSAATLARMAADLKMMGRTEIGEVFQEDGSVGSSTMPQKRNPVMYNYVLQAWGEIESIVQRMQSIRVVADDGDSLCNNVLKEGIVDIIKLYYAMLEKSQDIIKTLEVDTSRMQEHLQLDGGWIMAEPLMFALADELGKTEAHELLHDLAMASRSGGKTLGEIALEHPVISKLGKGRIQEILDPAGYTGECANLTRQTVERLKNRL